MACGDDFSFAFPPPFSISPRQASGEDTSQLSGLRRGCLPANQPACRLPLPTFASNKTEEECTNSTGRRSEPSANLSLAGTSTPLHLRASLLTLVPNRRPQPDYCYRQPIPLPALRDNYPPVVAASICPPLLRRNSFPCAKPLFIPARLSCRTFLTMASCTLSRSRMSSASFQVSLLVSGFYLRMIWPPRPVPW